MERSADAGAPSPRRHVGLDRVSGRAMDAIYVGGQQGWHLPLCGSGGGGQVYRDPLAIGTHFPTDFELYDMTGQPIDLSQLVSGRKTVIAFFVVAVPASVLELKKLQDFATEQVPQLQVFNVHANTIQADLTGGGPNRAVEDTIRTVALARKEHGLRNPTFVAPNDTMSPTGLSNRLGVRGVPTIFVLGADGKVQNIFIGPHDWKQGDL